MQIVHCSQTPIVGVPILVSNLMNKYLPGIESHCVQARHSYADKRTFEKDFLFSDSGALDVIRQADVVFIHNSVHNHAVLDIIKKRKRKILICHSQPFHIQPELFDIVDTVAVVGQYQPRLYADRKIALVPNLIDLSELLYQPVERFSTLMISFAPSNTNKWDPKSDWTWDRKGVEETRAILDRSGLQYIFMTKTPLEKVLKNSQRCAITIDELVTGSFHRRSLEGVAHATLTLNAMDFKCIKTMKWMTETDDLPFFIIRMNELSGVLDQAKRVPEWVKKEGRRARKWMVKNWDVKTLLKRWWYPLMVGENLKIFPGRG